jgi:hypothetical protein
VHGSFVVFTRTSVRCSSSVLALPRHARHMQLSCKSIRPGLLQNHRCKIDTLAGPLVHQHLDVNIEALIRSRSYPIVIQFSPCQRAYMHTGSGKQQQLVMQPFMAWHQVLWAEEVPGQLLTRSGAFASTPFKHPNQPPHPELRPQRNSLLNASGSAS